MPAVGHGGKARDILMRFRKTESNKRETYSYTDQNGKTIVIKAGDYSPVDNRPVTKEMIQYLHHLDDQEVENNLKNSKPRRTKKERELIKEWEQAHPGETVPKNYVFSLDQGSDNPDNDMDRSPVAEEIANLAQKREPCVERFYEVVDELSEEERYCLIEIKLKKRDLQDVIKESGLSSATIYRRISDAMMYIKNNF